MTLKNDVSTQACVFSPSSKRVQVFETLRGGVLMLLRWCIAYPLVYLQYTVKNLQRSPWRSGALQNFQGPGIIVCNHPNFLYDLLLVQVAAPRWCFFLVSQSFAKFPVVNGMIWLLRGVGVFRQKDEFLPEEERLKQHEATLSCVADHLVQGHWFTVFPEGSSHYNYKLNPLRGGVAKMALLAEEKAGWELPLKIFVVGLNYENQFAGRSYVYAQWAKPLDVRSYRDEKTLMDDVERALKECVLEAESFEQQAEAHRLAYERRETHFQGVWKALQELRAGHVAGGAKATAHTVLKARSRDARESFLYRSLGLLLWMICGLLGWPFRAFARWAARDPSEQLIYMLLLWIIVLVVGVIVSHWFWLWWTLGVTGVASASWLWAWRRRLT